MMTQNLKNEYLQAMGVQRWLVRTDGEDAVTDGMQVPANDIAEPVARDWAGLQQQVSGCKKCKLHETRTQTVFGVGNQQADWLIIGEAPGAEEDRQGEPFVGAAGKLLDEMLFAAGFGRSEVYIANILKCRPPGNRNPEVEEVACCNAYLQQQIALMQPQLILAVGGVAAHNLLRTDEKVGQMRGTLHHYGETNIPLVVTYHPAYLLRSPLEKRKVWDDLQFAQAVHKRLRAE
ncbi:MAG: uracil-DNA glycosylase [Gammaproteobacteria bacterium]|nr:uracil-DNA glycosylase [Gammaproteobacteria bacterium]MDH3970803.1 uracil-DNA glycosylase [Gammaproteobacteria bacterium]